MSNPLAPADLSQLALEIGFQLTPALKHAFLAGYPAPRCGVLIEQNYLNAWRHFADRLETGGYLEAQRRTEQTSDPAIARLRAAAYSLLAACDEIEREGA